MDNSSTLAIMRRQTANTLRQVERAIADLALFPAILNPVALSNVGDAAYKIQLIG